MSLKAFHLFFIVVATLAVFGFGAWGVYIFLTEGAVGYLLTGIVALACGVGLVFYAARFVQKMKHISYF